MSSEFESNLQNQEIYAWMKSKTASKLVFVSKSTEDTRQIAASLSQVLKPGDSLALQGTLGSGKTVFVKGIAQGLGIENVDEVKSPTFVIMHIYPTRIPLYHFDLYRLEEEKEVESIGFEDFVGDPTAITCVEWSERASRYFPKTVYNVAIEIQDETTRKITLESYPHD